MDKSALIGFVSAALDTLNEQVFVAKEKANRLEAASLTSIANDLYRLKEQSDTLWRAVSAITRCYFSD